MANDGRFDIFLATAPGLEEVLAAEVRTKGFNSPHPVPGGVTVRGGWPDVWRANLWLRGTSKVLARIAAFPVPRLADLERNARSIPWRAVLRPDVAVRVEAVCRSSRIYHSGAAAERVATAIAEAMGRPPVLDATTEAPVTVMVRIENDRCTIAVDTSGDLLHKRGFKEAVNKAPLRETLAALFLRACGYEGAETVVDPMCGSGTLVIEAAEIAARLNPGRARRFAFEHLATFDAGAWERMRITDGRRNPSIVHYGSDRDAGAVAMSRANADRAGVAAFCDFREASVSELRPPDTAPGLVLTNPPYGARLGDKTSLMPLYRALGQTLLTHFAGWRVGLLTTEPSLAGATGLPFLPTAAPVPHGGLRITLYRTAAL